MTVDKKQNDENSPMQKPGSDSNDSENFFHNHQRTATFHKIEVNSKDPKTSISNESAKFAEPTKDLNFNYEPKGKQPSRL